MAKYLLFITNSSPDICHTLTEAGVVSSYLPLLGHLAKIICSHYQAYFLFILEFPKSNDFVMLFGIDVYLFMLNLTWKVNIIVGCAWFSGVFVLFCIQANGQVYSLVKTRSARCQEKRV